jgi:3-methyl-2-oxobutanoate hydroxymethyltransferase
MLGGFRIQGREEAAVATMRGQAKELVAAGADCIVLELMPAAVARGVTQELSVPTIGIGAGSGCSGQVLVLHDMLGLTGGTTPRFVRNFLAQNHGIDAAVREYVADVKSGRFPDDTVHGY